MIMTTGHEPTGTIDLTLQPTFISAFEIAIEKIFEHLQHIENRLINLNNIFTKFENTLMATKHPGFKKVQSNIAAKQGISKKRAGAILAASSRNASNKAKKANPRLKRVKG